MIDLPWSIMALVVFGLILLFLFMGMPVAVSLGVVGVLSAYLLLGTGGMAAFTPWRIGSSFILSAIPLFVFMGQLLLYGGLSERLYNGSAALVSRICGGLLHANVVSCAIFAAVSGSSVATAATIGTIAIPALEERGYDTRLTLGSLAAGGTLGILIPPSIPLIIYGVMVEQSIGDLFLAGFLPGIMLASLFMIYIWVRVMLQPQLAPTFERIPLKRRLVTAKSMWPIVVIIFIILGGIYTGVFTPTEAAAVAASAALFFTLAYRRITWAILRKCLLDTVKTSSMVIFIVIGANIVAGTLGLLRIPANMATWVISLELPSMTILIFIYVMYIFLGCFFDGLSMMVLTLPIVFPILVKLGFDPIWFGIVLVILIEMAAITPPVGLNIYTIHGLRPNRPMGEVIRGSMPFFLIMCVALTILTAFPQISIWLPSTIAR